MQKLKLWSTITHITVPKYQHLGLEVCDALTEETGILHINRVVGLNSSMDMLSGQLESKDSSIVLFTPGSFDGVLPMYFKHLVLRCQLFSKKLICLVDSEFNQNIFCFMKNKENIAIVDTRESENYKSDLVAVVLYMHSGGTEWRRSKKENSGVQCF